MLSITFLALFLGLLFGSFLAAVTYRIPRNEEFVKSRSYCDNCKKALPWYVNIPILSYLFLHGKSLCCKSKISPRYIIIESISGLSAGLLSFFFAYPLFILYYILFMFTFAVLIIDWENQIIPDGLSLLIFILGAVFINNGISTNLFTGLLCASLLMLLHMFTKGRGMGLGDVKLAIALGVWFSLSNGLLWLITSFIIGGIVATFLLIFGKANMKTQIAFGPFMILAFWLIFFIK